MRLLNEPDVVLIFQGPVGETLSHVGVRVWDLTGVSGAEEVGDSLHLVVFIIEIIRPGVGSDLS